MRRKAAIRARGQRALALVACVACVSLLAACGSKDFKNDPRPPVPIELTAVINPKQVIISPKPKGAGPVTITISNQGSNPARLTLKGPTDESSSEIQPGQTGKLQTDLKQGLYKASAGAAVGVKKQSLNVGPERESGQNQLLLP